MALFDVSRDAAAGRSLPFADDCVYVLRAPAGNVTVKVDLGVTRDEAARLLAALGAGLGESKAREDADFTPGVGMGGKNSPAGNAREGGFFDQQEKNTYFESAKPLTFIDDFEDGNSSPAEKGGAADLPAASHSPSSPAPSWGVDPESVVRDLVRWGCGYAAYKLPRAGWWWVKWRTDTGERWGLSGPLLGAVEARKGPFDSFDETAASLFRYRFERESAGERP